MSEPTLSWLYSRPQLEAARQRVAQAAVRANEWPPLTPGLDANAIATEFGLLALAYEELLAEWERRELGAA